MKDFWRKWSYEVPLAISDALWEVLVVQLAALLDRLTLRQIVAFIPALILILAYDHGIPIPPELMLVGDVLAYIDVFSVILLLSMMSRAAAIWFMVKQATEYAMRLVSGGMQRLDFRHRRQCRTRDRKRLAGRAKTDDDEPGFGVAWAAFAAA